jgi:predicted transposase YdaD
MIQEARKMGRAEGRTEGRTEGRAEGEAAANARAVLTVLRARGIVVSDADRERILAEKAPACLERWLERAVHAASLAEVIAEPSRAA